MSETSEIVSRRFGPKFERKCERPEVIECALWECQSVGFCQHSQQARMAEVLCQQAARPIGIRPAPRRSALSKETGE